MIPLKDDIPSYRPPIVTIGLIVANCVIFFLQLSSGSQGFEMLISKYGAIPYEITHLGTVNSHPAFPIGLTLFSSMFMHGGFFHLVGNMLYLWIFGDNVEDRLGHIKFFIFYVTSGLIASFSYIITAPGSNVPMIGASGAISGVLGAYLLKFPRARISTLIFFGFFVRMVKIPAFLVLGFWFILQLLSGLPSLGAEASGGVAWFAHIGGFLGGMLLLKLFGGL
ncbi:MAG TPA: rhomboid family intramembrane serine protease [candidate division Zixibacteria bacterium]